VLGLHSADPLILAALRFTGTGLLFGPYFILNKNYRFWPSAKEWKPIIVYGLLNTTLTLGAFAAAQRYASAGISMLFIAVTPLIIALFSAMLLKRKLQRVEIIGMLIAFSGLILASVLDLPKAQIKPAGILLLLIYVVTYAFSSIYYSRLNLAISTPVFNVWQVFAGGVALWPFSFLFHQSHIHHPGFYLWAALGWMIIMLSFVANQLWLYLLKTDTVAAAGWLYLVPVLGYAYGYILLKEQIGWYAIAGTILVIIGLVVSKQVKRS